MGRVALTIAIGLAGAVVPASAAQSVGIERIRWLQGCWEMVSGERTVEEHWTSPRGKSMLGIGRTVRGDTLVDYELIIIREDGDRLAYEAHAAGQPPATFNSRAITDSAVVFENPEHDFPQRIGYQRTGAQSLLAWIEGTRDAQRRRIEFPYQRMACPHQ